MGWYWDVWALYKELKGRPAGEWLYVWYKAAKEFGAYANGLLGHDGRCEGGVAGPEGPAPLTRDQFTVLAGLEASSRGALHPDTLEEPVRSAVLDDLERQGLVHDGSPTRRGLSALEPYRVKRAVLLAAGFGSRLLPVTVNTPKPLARVRGVRIIDRLIDALMGMWYGGSECIGSQRH